MLGVVWAWIAALVVQIALSVVLLARSSGRAAPPPMPVVAP